jgi:hypothetical protein
VTLSESLTQQSTQALIPERPKAVETVARNAEGIGVSLMSRFSRKPRPLSDSVPAIVKKPQEWVLEPTEFTKLPDRPYQELWFELRSWSWKSLALVPTSPGMSEIDIAERLVVVGVSNTNRRLALISAEGATVSDTDRIIAMIRAAEARGDRAVVAVDPLVDNPAAAPIVRAVNGAVLVARIGQTLRSDMERTIALTGRNRIIGVVTRRD